MSELLSIATDQDALIDELRAQLAAQKARAEAAERERDEARDTSTLGYWGRAYAHSNNKRIELQDKLQTSEAARDAALSRVTQLREAMGRLPQQRDGFHATYNGGYHDDKQNSAFHHGMDTVFNWLDVRCAAALASTPAPDCAGILARVRVLLPALIDAYGYEDDTLDVKKNAIKLVAELAALDALEVGAKGNKE